MRRIVVWGLSTVSALVLLFGYSTSTAGPVATIAPPISGTAGTGTDTGTSGTAAAPPDPTSDPTPDPTTAAPSDTPTPSATPSASPSASPSAKPTRSPTTTTVTGSVAQTRWGPVQLQLSVTAGKIAKVSVLQYPQGNGRDIEINDVALPILIQETVAAQSADIDMVSGATVTSDGYLESLQSALDRAGL